MTIGLIPTASAVVVNGKLKPVVSGNGSISKHMTIWLSHRLSSRELGCYHSLRNGVTDSVRAAVQLIETPTTSSTSMFSKHSIQEKGNIGGVSYQ